MALLLLFPMVVLVGVVAPLLAWLADEGAGRPRWARFARRTESVPVGEGPFRGRRVDVVTAHSLRDRAPLVVRLVAFTCYLPLGAAFAACLPWLCGVCFAACDIPGIWTFDRQANALLVLAYPFGCWAAARMHTLGGALLGGDVARFHRALLATARVVLPLNVVLLVAAAAFVLRFPHEHAGRLAVAPALTLLQLAMVASSGHRHLGSRADDGDATRDDGADTP